ncbi:MAG: hypothetical protein ABIO80_07725 [Sphingomicrobium sp.]
MATALALPAAVSLSAQPSSPAIADQAQTIPIGGTWTYAAGGGSSEASFTDGNGHAQLRLTCTRVTRRVTLSKPANLASPTLAVWTSTQSRNVAAGFDAATARLSAQFANWDPLLDAIAFSRGRFAVSASGQPALVVPSWGDISRVVEDCRV